MKYIEDKKALTKSFYLKNSFEKIDKNVYKFLLQFSKKNNKCDVRLCIHPNPKSLLHNMIILQNKKNYYIPHKHLKTGDTVQVIMGSLACFLFDNNGRVKYKCVLNRNEILKTPINVYHTFLPKSEQVIYYETKNGPFVRNSKHTIFPNWSPKLIDNKIEINRYKKNLFQKLLVK